MIDFQLEGFPLLNQNKEPANSYPDVNAGMDCVPTSIAAAMTWLTGLEYYGDELIDAVYGSTYTGGTAASAYVDYCAARGVILSSIDGTPANLVADLHTLVHQQKPCLVTIPGQWNDPNTSGQNPGDVTHVCCVCGDGPGAVRMMNPWGGFMQDVDDSWLEKKLCYGQIWPMEAHMIPDGWTEDAANKILTAPNKITVESGFYNYVTAHEWDPSNWPLAAAYSCPEQVSPVRTFGPGSRQDFSMLSLGWTAEIGHEFVIPIGEELAAAKAAPAPTPPPTSDLAALVAEIRDVLTKLQAARAPSSGGEATPTPDTTPTPEPEPEPQVQAEPVQISVPEGWKPYVVLAEDIVQEAKPALHFIADKLGLGNAFGDLWKPNMDTIESAARAAGHQSGSNQGEVLVPGTVLLYR